MGNNTVYFVEAQGGNLIIDGHYYRVPAQPTDAPLWPLDTFHLMLRSYVMSVNHCIPSCYFSIKVIHLRCAR